MGHGYGALSRRTVVVGAIAALVTASGCQGERWYPSEITSDEYLLRNAITAKQRMIARYEATLNGGQEAGSAANAELLAKLLDDHQKHLKALKKRLPKRGESTPSPEPSESARVSAVPEEPISASDLRVAEENASDERGRQTSHVTDTDLAQLIASIGASEAGHAHQLSEAR